MAEKDKKAKTKPEEELVGKPAPILDAAPRPEPIEPLPPARGGLLTWLLILILTGILAALLLVLGFVFDYLGVLNLRNLLPEQVKTLPAVRDYLDEASLISAGEDEKLRFYRQRMEIEFERAAEEMKRREFLLERHRDELDRHEKAMRDDFSQREKALLDEESRMKTRFVEQISQLATREVALRSREVEFEHKVDALLTTSESELTIRIESLAKVYERMEPIVAADNLSRVSAEIALQVLLAILPRKAAKILEQMNPEMSAKFFNLMSPEQAAKLKR